MKSKNGLKRMTMTKREDITFPELKKRHIILLSHTYEPVNSIRKRFVNGSVFNQTKYIVD